MRKHLSIVIITILFLLVCSLLIFLVKAKLENKKSNQYIANNTETEILKTESKEEITYTIKDYEKDLTYSWSFKKDEKYLNSLKEDMDLETDLKLDVLTENYNKNIEEKVENKDKLVISFNYHGMLPTTAKVRIKVSDNFKDKDKLYLYYYNPEKDRIEYMDKGLEVKNGYVEFKIDHCSDYFLTASVVQEAVNNPKNINLVIVGMVVVVIILIAATLFQSKK